ncbi:cell wall-binding repeat-containing protein [Desulfosporosinus nitroreducens]|uniref:Cell wall-binding repeat-containing protein n=1 Tax=Desulfosporosinus nitroreducens TaxID=2018668 RepID=A0ABT8QPG3_9FIRM|nr:cell wall-binding repeat-containing protein [Desulfosporosinus nitroreducens]MDO0823242.1 cell wall-binding repeat-containing protein [Desulfosporosinus nitroreducens]
MRTKKLFASLTIAGMALTMVPLNVFAAGTVPTRLAGITAEQTAIKIADQTGWTGTAILASSASYGMVDALTSGPLASYLRAPILLTGPGKVLDPDTKEELVKLAVAKVYVTSGTAVISQGVLDELAAMKITVVSLGGVDRFETSVNIAKQMVTLGASVSKVAVAYGWLIQDALSIASIASQASEPILLTDSTGLSSSAQSFLQANPGIKASDVIGGTGVIYDAVLAQLPTPTRHFGITAYDTNDKVIKDFAASLEFNQVYLANGVTGIDALSGAPLAAQTKSAIVLTDGVTSPVAGAFVKGNMSAASVVTALGGEAVVSESQRNLGVGAVDASVQTAIVGKKIEDMANRFDIPPVLLKAIAHLESGWKQYELDPTTGLPLTDKPFISKDGGIGIMQISPANYPEYDVEKLKSDLDYNLEVGCRILNNKWRAYPKIGDGNRNVLENWYFAVWGYNAWTKENNPNYYTGEDAYQDKVFGLMGRKYNSTITFAPGATNFAKSLLPSENPPSLSSCWSTPVPVHVGDLAFDLESLIFNGDYWYEYEIDQQPRGDFYVQGLGFYITAYNNPLVTVADKAIVSQKILSSYDKLLDEADALVLEDKDTSYAIAAKYYWTVLQGPNLDPEIKDRANTGYQSALAKQ